MTPGKVLDLMESVFSSINENTTPSLAGLPRGLKEMGNIKQLAQDLEYCWP